MRKALPILLLVGLLVAIPVLAVQDYEEATVAVTISQQLWIDITPESLHWGQDSAVDPGSIPDCDTSGDEGSSCLQTGDLGTYADHNVYGVEVENIGSLNITHIWLNTSMPTSNPFATGQRGAYDAANFIAVSLNNASGFHFVNRKEFAMPRKPIYLKVPAGVGGVSTDNTGRLRSGNQERFWALAPNGGPDGKCNETGTNFYITSGNVHNETLTGDIDLTDETPVPITECTTDPTFGCGNVTVSMHGETYNYALIIPSDCSYVIFTRYNADLVHYGQNLLYDEGYLWDNDTMGYTFNPGNYTPIYVEARIPYGVAVGSLQTGYLRVFADNT